MFSQVVGVFPGWGFGPLKLDIPATSPPWLQQTLKLKNMVKDFDILNFLGLEETVVNH